MAAPRTRTLPRATPISWEAEAPTERFPAIPLQRTAPDNEVLPAAAPYGTGPFAAPTAPAPGVAGRFAVSAAAAVLALLIAVVEAEPLVGDLRDELDVNAARGVPAHVTVLYPFLPIPEIDLPALREVVAATPSFTATFRRVGWFGDDVVWLAPEPVEPFVALTVAVQERFRIVPYGGEHGSEPVPHLTVGHRAAPARLRAVAARLETGLPFTAEIRSAQLLTGSRLPNSWRTVAKLPLG